MSLRSPQELGLEELLHRKIRDPKQRTRLVTSVALPLAAGAVAGAMLGGVEGAKTGALHTGLFLSPLYIHGTLTQTNALEKALAEGKHNEIVHGFTNQIYTLQQVGLLREIGVAGVVSGIATSLSLAGEYVANLFTTVPISQATVALGSLISTATSNVSNIVLANKLLNQAKNISPDEYQHVEPTKVEQWMLDNYWPATESKEWHTITEKRNRIDNLVTKFNKRSVPLTQLRRSQITYDEKILTKLNAAVDDYNTTLEAFWEVGNVAPTPTQLYKLPDSWFVDITGEDPHLRSEYVEETDFATEEVLRIHPQYEKGDRCQFSGRTDEEIQYHTSFGFLNTVSSIQYSNSGAIMAEGYLLLRGELTALQNSAAQEFGKAILEQTLDKPVTDGQLPYLLAEQTERLFGKTEE